MSPFQTYVTCRISSNFFQQLFFSPHSNKKQTYNKNSREASVHKHTFQSAVTEVRINHAGESVKLWQHRQ